MPRVFHVLLHFSALAGVAFADVPRKEPYSKYTQLWTNSPFTSKPPPPEQGPAVNPLEDYVLLGVSPVTGGYRVTILNKKKPEERLIIESERPRDGFKILGVTRKPGDPLGTVVRMQSGSITGNVAFDESMLTLAPPPAANPQPPAGAQPPIPGQPPQANQPLLRQPRPRVVPPPPANGQAQQPGQPQALPPGVQIPQNQARPERRR